MELPPIVKLRLRNWGAQRRVRIPTRMKRSVFFLFLAASLVLPGAGSGQSAPEPSRKERLAALPDDERKWLTEFVAPIILPPEEALFLKLHRTAPARDFQGRVLETAGEGHARSPDGTRLPAPVRGAAPGGRREYDGYRNDAGRMVIRFGEPASVQTFEMCKRTLKDVEVWTYNAVGREARSTPATSSSARAEAARVPGPTALRTARCSPPAPVERPSSRSRSSAIPKASG